jgi:hypothetical protein
MAYSKIKFAFTFKILTVVLYAGENMHLALGGEHADRDIRK